MEPPPDLDRLALLETLSKNNFGLIRLADRKAQTLLRLALALFMVAFIGVPPAVVALKQFLGEGGWKAGLFVAVIVLYAVCSACLLVAIMKIIAVIRPRVIPDEDRPATLFFAGIAGMEAGAFRRRLHELTYEDTVDDMISQVYATAVITDHKYEKLNDAISWMLGGGLFGVVFALILLVTIGLT